MSRKARKNVGLIGLGIIGARVAAGLRAGGYQVYVWNRSAKPAPNFLGSPVEVAESAEIIQIFVADGAALMDVIEAMSEALTSKHLVICSSTVGPEAVLEAAQMVEARGAQFLDAPFTGSKSAADKRQLVYYVGGSDAAFLRARPVLELTSRAIVRMGEIGHASTIKVVTNMISAVTTQALAESLSIVQKAGLPPELLAAAIEQNACRSGVIDLKLPKMLSGDYEPHFSLKHMFKDVQLGIHMANSLDIEIPATTVTAGVLYGALNHGWGDLDYSVLFKNYGPAESFDELPALENMPEQPELLAGDETGMAIGGEAEPWATAGESSEATPGNNGAAPTDRADAEAISTDSSSAEAASTEPEPTESAPAEPVSDGETAASDPVTAEIPMREIAPTEEAARIIDAVLAHVSRQRAEAGPGAERFGRPSIPASTDRETREGVPRASSSPASAAGFAVATNSGSVPATTGNSTAQNALAESGPVTPSPGANPSTPAPAPPPASGLPGLVRRWFSKPAK